jgi:hypothetical protein
MSIPNFITIITGVGMWVTPRRPSTKVLTTFLELSTFKRQTKQRVSLRRKVNNSAFKTEKRPVLTTNRFSLQAGIKPP